MNFRFIYWLSAPGFVHFGSLDVAGYFYVPLECLVVFVTGDFHDDFGTHALFERKCYEGAACRVCADNFVFGDGFGNLFSSTIFYYGNRFVDVGKAANFT